MLRRLSQVSLTLCLFAATVFLGLPSAHAASVKMAGITDIVTSPDQNGAVALTNRLVASHQQVTPGQAIQVAWEFKLQPHWHIYWSNPGDSGLPPALKDQSGATLPLTWPTPKVINIPPITNYGYEDSVTLTATYIVPTSLAAGNHTLAFKGSYLYCKDICMPGKAEFQLPLTVANKDKKTKEFKSAENMPEVLAAKSPGLVAETTGQSIQLSLPLSLSQTGARFIPATDGVIDDAAPQSLTGNTLSIARDTQATETPEELKGLILINGKGYEFTTPLHQLSNTPHTSENKPTPATDINAFTPNTSLMGAIFFAFLAGLILNLMPCVLPVLSLKLLGLVKHHHGQSRVHHTMAYSAGVLASFWAFAICIALFKTGTTQLGWGFQLQNPLFVATLTLLLLTIALNFFGVFELGQSLTRLGGSPQPTHRASLATSFGTGVLAVIVATPCTVPFMGGAMAYALTQSLAESLLIFTALGIGLAFPFLIAIPFPKVFRWLPKPGKWVATFRHVLGWPMLATALWLGYVFGTQAGLFAAFALLTVALGLAFALWLYGTKPAIPTLLFPLVIALAGLAAIPHNVAPPAFTSQQDVWQTWSEKAVEEARQKGHPVFVHFTASWCLTCKVTEATVLNTKEVQTLFTDTNTHLFRGDWTTEDPAITAELARHNRQGVPLYLLYLPNKAEAEILPQLLTKALLKEKLGKPE